MISSTAGRRRAMSSFQKTKVMDVGWNIEGAIQWMLGFWVIFTVIVPVYGQIQSSRKDVLKGNSGEDSCALKHAVEATCSSSPSTQIDNPTPSGCTCNNLYFNIWSSCLLSSGQTTLPTYSNWTLSCKSFGVPMLNNNPVPLGTQIPKWAFLQVPGDTTFDVQAAVLVANPQRWTPLQVALPWCSAVLTLITTVAFIKFWRRPKSGKGLPFSHRIDHSFSSVRFWTPRVKEVDTRKVDGEWSIDSPNEGAGSIKSGGPGGSSGAAKRKDTYETYVFVDREERSPISPVDTIPAHPSVPSSDSQGRFSIATDSAVLDAENGSGRRGSEALRDRLSLGMGGVAMGAGNGRARDAGVLDLDLTEGDDDDDRPPGGLVHVPGLKFPSAARNAPFISSPHRTNGTHTSSYGGDLTTPYPFSSPTSRMGSQNSRTASPASGILGSIRSFGNHLPWSKRRHRIESMKPTKKFRIDQDRSTKASSTAGSGASDVGGGASDVLLGEHDHEHDDPELALAMHLSQGGGMTGSNVGYGDVDEDEERQTLLTEPEKESSIMMIGNPGRSVGSSSASAYSQPSTNISTSVNSHIEIISATSGPGSPTRSINPTNSRMLSPPPVPAVPIALPPPPSIRPPPAPPMSSRAHLRDLPSAFDHSQWAPLQPSTNSPTISPQNLAQSDPRGFTSNLHIQTHSLSKPSTSFSLRDLGASESPLAPPPAHRFHTMTPIQEDARSYAGRSSPTISSVSTPRPSSPALSYVASPSAPRSSSPSPAISSFSIPPAPRRNHSGDSSHSVNVLSPNSSSDHSRSGSITTPTTPLNVGMRWKNSNDSAALLSPSSNPDLSSPLSAAPSSTSSNHGIMQVISMSPRPRTPDPLLVTLSQSELVRSMSSDSARSGRSIRPLPSPGIPQGGLQHQKSFSQSDVSSSPQPFRTHTPTLSGSILIGTGSPLAHPQSYFDVGHRPAPDDGFDSVLTAGEISRTTGGHRRGLVPDDRSSFYMTSDPLLTPDATRAFSPQRRNFSSENSTPNERAVDPISLMPAAVRGAGYRIDANAPVDLA